MILVGPNAGLFETDYQTAQPLPSGECFRTYTLLGFTRTLSLGPFGSSKIYWLRTVTSI